MLGWKFQNKLYPHFDRVLKNKKQAEKLVKDRESVARHSFLPFIEKKQKNRKFKKYLKAQQSKKNQNISQSKIRPIKYASHKDAQIFSYYRELISQKYEEKLIQLQLTNNVIAYRKIPIKNEKKCKCNIHFARDAFDIIVNTNSCAVLTFDISSFFESLNHDFLKEKLKYVLGVDCLSSDYKAVFKALTQYSIVEYGDCYEVLGLTERKNGKTKYLHCPRYIFKRKKILCSKKKYCRGPRFN